MNSKNLISPNIIRSQFTASLSAMYCKEVPQYDALLSLVKTVNEKVLDDKPDLILSVSDEFLEIERHGAIRLGTAQELSNMRRLFAVMGMYPVDYYDLSVAGIPVHSTAFRATNLASLKSSPFRVFTSLLRLELINDSDLRHQAEQILAKRNIFSHKLMSLIHESENNNGLTIDQSDQFVGEALETFRWHETATVTKQVYSELNQSHRLIADVVSFKGPHINHLTPRTLDIDVVQSQLDNQGFKAKAVVEGPPARACPILLRQTSFIALQEAVIFADGEEGTHTARFGEIEQRGIALTPKGRELYDRLLQQARSGDSAIDYQERLQRSFDEFPDNHQLLREQALAYYQYSVGSQSLEKDKPADLEVLISKGSIEVTPIVYEDFLPVSAAGIFQSNLADDKRQAMQQSPNQKSFEDDLGSSVIDSFSLYERLQKESLDRTLKALET